MSEKILDLLKEAYEARLFTSASVGVTYGIGQKQMFSFEGGRAERVDSFVGLKVYDIASVTKFMLTLLVFRLITIRKELSKEALLGKDKKVWNAGEIGRFDIDLPVTSMFPICGPFSESLLVRHLLNFHAEFNKFSTPEQILRMDKIEHLINELRVGGFASLPGAKYRYANAHSILLGRIIETVFASPLEHLFQKHLLTPLGLKDTCTNPSGILNRTVPSLPGLPVGIVHDSVARMALKEGRLIGSAGFFSSSADLLKLVDLILHQGYFPNSDGTGSDTKRESFIHPGWIDRLHHSENKKRDFATGMGYWDNLRYLLEEHNSTKVEDGLMKTGWTGSAVAVFRKAGWYGAGFAFTSNFSAITRTGEELEGARLRRSILYLKLGQCVIEEAQKF